MVLHGGADLLLVAHLLTVLRREAEGLLVSFLDFFGRDGGGEDQISTYSEVFGI